MLVALPSGSVQRNCQWQSKAVLYGLQSWLGNEPTLSERPSSVTMSAFAQPNEKRPSGPMNSKQKNEQPRHAYSRANPPDHGYA
jgi:hypothetical protein